MRGFILAAGFGTRLKPLTEHVTKALIPVCGVSLLERNLAFLYNQGIHKFGVNAHYLPDDIFSFRERSSIPFEIFHEKDAILGTGGALYFARDFLSQEELFCVVNVDIISTVDIQQCVKTFLGSDCIGALIAAPSKVKGTVYYDPVTLEYRGAQSSAEKISGAAEADFIGMALYRRDILRYIDKHDFSILPVWEKVQKRGLSMKVLVQRALYWRDTGSAYALARIHFDVMDKKVKLTTPSGLHIDYNKKIACPRTISSAGKSSLGEYVWTESDAVETGADVRYSIILKGATVQGRVYKKILTQWGGIPFETE
jgi:NDP-sugar pyrophosphorylase family protein